MVRRHLARLLAVAGLAMLVACGGGGGGSPSTGALQLKITDGPFPDDCVANAWISFDGVQARTQDGWTDIPLVDPDGFGVVELDLLDLNNALDAALAFGDVPVGAIDEIRLHIVESTLGFADATPPRTFKVPSGMASGLKLKIDPPILVAPGETMSLVIDVNAAESFHSTGVGGDPTCEELKSGEAGAIFSPVLRVLNEDTRGVVTGIVSDATGTSPHEDLEVRAYEAGTYAPGTTPAPDPVAFTFSASAGSTLEAGTYALLLEPGTYDLFLDFTPDDDTDALTEGAMGVVVASGQIVDVDILVDAPAAP